MTNASFSAGNTVPDDWAATSAEDVVEQRQDQDLPGHPGARHRAHHLPDRLFLRRQLLQVAILRFPAAASVECHAYSAMSQLALITARIHACQCVGLYRTNPSVRTQSGCE